MKKKFFFSIFTAVVLCSCSESNDSAKISAKSSRTDFVAHLSQFDSLATTQGGRCAIGAINSIAINPDNSILKSDGISIEGWAVGDNSTLPSDLAIKLVPVAAGESFFAPASRKISLGLGQALGDGALDGAGFEISANLDSVPSGRYSIFVLQRTGSAVISCEPNIGTTIK